MSFKLRIWLIFGILTAVLIIIFTVVNKKLENKAFLRYAKNNAISKLRHIDWVLRNEREINRISELQDFLIKLGENLNVRVALLDQQGKILADSVLEGKNSGKEDRYLSGDEIDKSLKRNLGLEVGYSDNLQQECVLLAKKTDLQIIGREQQCILHLSSPLPEQFMNVHTNQAVFLVAYLILSLIAVFLCSLMLSKRLRNRIATLRQATEGFAHGNLEDRVDLDDERDFLPLVKSLNRMAKSVQTHLYQIEAQKEESLAIINGMHEGLLVLDNRGRIKLTNKRIENNFAFSENVLGKKPIEVIRSPELQDVCNYILENQYQNIVTKEIQLPEQKYYDASIVPHILEDESLEIIIVLHDISELKRLEQIRRDFVANVSHELRTPLTSIKGYSETLLSVDPNDRETMNYFVETIRKHADNMHYLLQDLMQLARLESQENKNNLEPIDAVGALASAWEICTSRAEEKQIRLDNKFPRDSVIVESNFEQLVRIFTNLLENAIKYTYEGDTIQVGVSKQEDKFVFYVQDNGPGISSHIQDRIFERFFREQEAHSKQLASGTGLGLSICKHIVTTQGGDIWVESPVPGEIQGSIFYFTLQRVN